MMYETVNKLHEMTQTVKLVDVDPRFVQRSDKGLPFRPAYLSLYWVQENAGTWELMSVTVKGKSVKDGKLGRYDRSRTYWGQSRDLPGWIGEIVNAATPIEVLVQNGEV